MTMAKQPVGKPKNVSVISRLHSFSQFTPMSEKGNKKYQTFSI